MAPRCSIGVWFIFRFPSACDNAKAEADLGFATTVLLVDTFRREIQWMESTSRLPRIDAEPCKDCLLGAWRAGQNGVDDPRWLDVNPWGNRTEN